MTIFDWELESSAAYILPKWIHPATNPLKTCHMEVIEDMTQVEEVFLGVYARYVEV